ncbi:MAG: DUF1573 domain-containing protein [Muribaculaceae bacterium]|nr:DUF1573 domain-containing protein [Muribaculaceae bacterium]
MKVYKLIVTIVFAIIPIFIFAENDFDEFADRPRDVSFYPLLSADNYSFDFGEIDKNKGVVKHRFIIKNTGNKPLIIIGGASSCGCTKVKFSKKPIKKGKTGWVEISFDPRTKTGTFSHFGTITTNAYNKQTNKQNLVVRFFIEGVIKDSKN